MSGRIFQNSVLQFKETTDRTIGVIDAEGTVIACSELTAIGKRVEQICGAYRFGGRHLRGAGGQVLQGAAQLGQHL